MKNREFRPIGGFTLIEVLIVVAILAVLGRFVLVIGYAEELRQWEDALWQSIGLNPEGMKFIVGVFGVVFFFWWGWDKSKKQLRSRRGKLKLPGD